MTATESKKSNTWLTIILVILGVIAVFAIGVLLSNIIGKTESTPPPADLPTPAPGKPMATATDFINVRTGPSLNYPILGVAPPGSTAEIIGKSEDGGWWAVKLPDNQAGIGEAWVSADYTEAEGAENVPILSAPPLDDIIIPTPEPGAPTAEALDAINVRSGPGTDYPSYGVAPEGMLFEVVGVSEDGGWWVVSIPPQVVQDGQGWVSDDYVRISDTGGVPVVPAP